MVWLNRCENFFHHQRTPEEERVSLASLHLEEDAQVWYLKLARDKPQLTWANFKYHCNLRFGPPTGSNKLGELSKLKQTGSVEQFQRQFEKLSAQTASLTSEQGMQIFIGGLREDIAVEVKLHNPPDLSTAMSLAQLYERRITTRKAAAQPSRRGEGNSIHRPMEAGAKSSPYI